MNNNDVARQAAKAVASAYGFDIKELRKKLPISHLCGSAEEFQNFGAAKDCANRIARSIRQKGLQSTYDAEDIRKVWLALEIAAASCR